MASGKYYTVLVLWMLALKFTSSQSVFDNVECVTDLQQEDCPDGTYYVKDASFEKKCPGCVPRIGTFRIYLHLTNIYALKIN